ncbi:MAG TPA: hypothetical protein VGT05_00935 [Patescibacteria group bacterium]|nr:hypothetical protein [Patescibacteria group bacterium]
MDDQEIHIKHTLVPSPTDVGFEPNIQGLDVTQNRFTGITNTTAIRERQWKNALQNVALIAGNDQMRRQAITTLDARLLSLNEQGQESSDEAVLTEYVKNMFTYFPEPTYLRSVIRRGGRSVLQESLLHGRQAFLEGFSNGADLQTAISGSLDLAEQMYLQQHQGKDYLLLQRTKSENKPQ